MSFNVHIEHDYLPDHLKLYVRELAGSRVFLYQQDGTIHNYSIGDRAPTDIKPTLEIPRDAAPALLASLAHFLGAVEHPAQLRADYDAERARVDRFISAMLASR